MKMNRRHFFSAAGLATLGAMLAKTEFFFRSSFAADKFACPDGVKCADLGKFDYVHEASEWTDELWNKKKTFEICKIIDAIKKEAFIDI